MPGTDIEELRLTSLVRQLKYIILVMLEKEIITLEDLVILTSKSREGEWEDVYLRAAKKLIELDDEALTTRIDPWSKAESALKSDFNQALLEIVNESKQLFKRSLQARVMRAIISKIRTTYHNLRLDD